MAINQITKIRLQDGTEVGLTDWSSRPIYSTIDLLSGFVDEEIRAFSYIESETVASSANLAAAARRVATLRDTNIDSRSELASTEEYMVYSIEVEMSQFVLVGSAFQTSEAGLPTPVGPVVALAHQALVLELEVSEKAFPQMGLGFFGTGFGPQIMATSAAAARTYANNGVPSREAVYEQPIPVHLGGTEDYSIIVHNPGGGAVTFRDDTGATDLDAILQLRILLCGLHKRPTA